jgi:CHASE2 domain-containing sensor protein
MSWMTDFMSSLEHKFYDFASSLTARRPSSQIAVIAIDAPSLASIGPLPWPRDVHVRLVDQLAAAGAKTVVSLVDFGPLPDRGAGFIRDVKQALLNVSDPATLETLAAVITQAEIALAADTRLARAAAGVDRLRWMPDPDGVLRREQLLVRQQGQVAPSLALMAAANSLKLAPNELKLNGPETLQWGTLQIKMTDKSYVWPQFYPARNGQPAFALDSFAEVLSGKIPASNYADKIVFIGVTAAGLAAPLAVPGHAVLSQTEIAAHVTSSLLRGHLYTEPGWAVVVIGLVLMLLAAWLVFGLPALSPALASLGSLLLLMALVGAEFGLLVGAGLWLKLLLPATLLLIGHLVITLNRGFMAPLAGPDAVADSAETSRMMGLALQGQGQLDMAFERFCRVPMTDSLMGNLYQLALDFEAKNQPGKATAVYQHMARHDKDYKDLQVRLQPPGVAAPLPMLGRYRIDKELGKGAMGVVYLGKDSKIGRVVALKTMALSEEFEGRDLVDARERFFREAETAGRLQHQNIVTIYDAGEERDLAFIAMEFLKGSDLAGYCKPGHLLPVPLVLSIVARVADALAYAHRHNVVHRDIKPANIMYDAASDILKVTDFGIARITDSSKTRTGLVLGTPSFMSPEQLAGKKVDGRSDLYSLGVMLFQLLGGVLPFRGESLAELMHKIAAVEAPDILLIRADLPPSLASLVAKALSKRPEDRYPDGDQLAQALRAVLSGVHPVDLEI